MSGLRDARLNASPQWPCSAALQRFPHAPTSTAPSSPACPDLVGEVSVTCVFPSHWRHPGAQFSAFRRWEHVSSCSYGHLLPWPSLQRIEKIQLCPKHKPRKIHLIVLWFRGFWVICFFLWLGFRVLSCLGRVFFFVSSKGLQKFGL